MTRINLDTTAKIWRCALPRGCSKLVLQAFAHHINSDEAHPHYGLAWPSVQRVALMCGMNPRTVQGHVRALQNAGLLRPRLRTGRTTLYQVNTAALVPLVFSTDTIELDADGNPVDNSAAPFPGAADAAKNLQDFDTESAENDTKHAGICTLKLDLKLDSKQEDSPAAAPASPVPPYPLFECITPETLADFAACRKDKYGRGVKGKVTEALISQIAEQATLAGMTLQAALEYCCHAERRWASFNAGWLKPKASAPAAPAPAMPVKVWEPDTTPIPPAPPVVAATVAKPAPAAAPAMPTGATDIHIAADAPPWAALIVTKLRTGQPVSRISLHSACAVLKLDPAMFRRAAPSTAARMH